MPAETRRTTALSARPFLTGWWLLAILGTSLLAASCQPDNFGKEIPAFVEIDTFVLRTDQALQGSASEKITEVWLNVDGDFLGAYSLPARVPLLGGGQRQLSLQAGIRDNGISRSPEVYPFYSDFERRLELQPGATLRLSPEISYLGQTRFAFIEDFESGRPIFGDLQVGNPDNELRPVAAGAFEGDFSGRIRLTRESPVVQLATLDRYRDLDGGGTPLYLEVNYRSDVPVVFGLIGYDDALPTQPNLLVDPGFLPSTTWNKIYFNFTPLLLQADNDAYQVVLQAAIPREEGDYVMEEATIWLDNIKLVHF